MASILSSIMPALKGLGGGIGKGGLTGMLNKIPAGTITNPALRAGAGGMGTQSPTGGLWSFLKGLGGATSERYGFQRGMPKTQEEWDKMMAGWQQLQKDMYGEQGQQEEMPMQPPPMAPPQTGGYPGMGDTSLLEGVGEGEGYFF